MKTVKFFISSFAILALPLLAMSSAQAQATRTWVSGVGDDVNPCSRTAPCKTFAGAISKTAAGGEISVLDPGGFGAVTITKSITLNGAGTLAGILNSLTTGIIINDSGAGTAVVTLRNLSINAGGNGLQGIKIFSAKTVIVENCQISGNGGSPGHGIFDARTNTGTTNLIVSDTEISNNFGTAIMITPTTSVSAAITRVQLIANTNSGIFISNGNATISDSVIAGNTQHGLNADTSNGIINSENTRISGNGNAGVIVTGGGIIRLSNTFIVNNAVGYNTPGGAVFSFGNTRVAGNTANFGSLVPLTPE